MNYFIKIKLEYVKVLYSSGENGEYKFEFGIIGPHINSVYAWINTPENVPDGSIWYPVPPYGFNLDDSFGYLLYHTPYDESEKIKLFMKTTEWDDDYHDYDYSDGHGFVEKEIGIHDAGLYNVEITDDDGNRVEFCFRVEIKIFAPSFTDASSVSNPPETLPGIMIYKDTYYGGDSKFLAPGAYSFGERRTMRGIISASPFNDEIDSIEVGKGYFATLFKTADFSGESIEIFNDTPTPYFDDNWRDQISSIIVGRLSDRIR